VADLQHPTHDCVASQVDNWALLCTQQAWLGRWTAFSMRDSFWGQVHTCSIRSLSTAEPPQEQLPHETQHIMASHSRRDSASTYEHNSFAASDPQMEDFSIDLLLSRVEELQRSEKLATLQKLTHRNALLRDVIIEYQQQWCCALNLLEKTQEARLSIHRAIEHCVSESAAAEKIWLAYWGIRKEHVKNPPGSSSFATWI
jgi:hypothetical protein